MSENKAVTWINEKDMKRDLRRRKIANFKKGVWMWWHGVYWRALHLTRLAGPYSKLICKLNIYRKYPDGRCMWCGEVHG